MTAPRPGQVGGVPQSATAAPSPTREHPRIGLRRFVVFLVLAGIGVVLDGATGAIVAVAVFAALLAGLHLRLLAWAGVACLALAPISVLVRGVPSTQDVSPEFVTGSLWPHHLTFAGLALLGSYAVLDVVEHWRAAPRPVGEDVEPLGSVGLRARVALVACAAVVGLAAIVAVVVR